MAKRVIGLIVSGSMISMMGCSSSRHQEESAAPQPAPIGVTTAVRDGQDGTTAVREGQGVTTAVRTGHGVTQNALPKTVIYRTNRDVDNHVAVVLTPDRKGVVSFPAPSDVGAFSTPLRLADGWLLDRRGGIGTDTAFLNYTYGEYAALAQTPSADSIMAMIMPGVDVTEAYRLDMPLNDALADTAAVNRMIAKGLPGANPLVTSVRGAAPPEPK